MKNVILYVRVSTDEQAKRGFSLRDQEEKLLKYCRELKYTVVGIYREDYSAKTFNRPEFKKLRAFCKKKTNKVDIVLFTKWDRFSRNAAESYQVIREFERLGVKMNTIEQTIDFSVPENDIMLSIYITVPEVENKRRSLNIISGTRKAYKEGRYVSSAPKGYDNGRDAEKKSILVPNKDAPLVKKAFELVASGIYNQQEVLTKVNALGLKTSKTALARILRNHLYYGFIYLKPYLDEPAQMIQGIHQPIITKKLFDKVQRILEPNNQSKVTHKKLNPKFPLKDFVVCPSCKKSLKASSSKGRSNYYSYYHCYTPCNTRYKMEDVELWTQEFLASISLDKNMQELVIELIKERFKEISKSSAIGPKHYQLKTQLNEKLTRARDLLLDGDFTKEEYHQMKNNIQHKLEELEQKEVNHKESKEIFDIYKEGIKKLKNLDKLFVSSPLEDKRRLLGSIIGSKFQFEDEKVRTADINPVLLMIASINKGYRGNKKGTNPKKSDLSRVVHKAGKISNFLIKDLEKLINFRKTYFYLFPEY